MSMRKILGFTCLLVVLNYALAFTSDAATSVKLIVGDIVITAELDDSETSRGFLATLPRTMSMTRYDDREFYGKIGHPLSENGERLPDYVNGDITYYPDGGSFAIFYAKEESSNQSGLIRMGKITSDLGAFAKLSDSVEMKIEVL